MSIAAWPSFSSDRVEDPAGGHDKPGAAARASTLPSMRRRTLAAALLAVAALAGGMAGCGDEASDRVRSGVDRVTSEARAVIQQDLSRARAEIDDLIAQAQDRGGEAARRAQEQAEAVIADARRRADEAIAQAEAEGRTEDVEKLRAEAQKRIRDLRARVERAFR